jgi:hypothetical protein
MRITVSLPHVYEWNARNWASDNCESYLSCTMYGSFGVDGSRVDYHFADEKDAMVFKLKWL